MEGKNQPPGIEPFDVVLPPSPYPGLRPFEKREWPIFFGREPMTAQVIDRLMDHQFIVVHGDSGCGKSSLIRAGVQVQLEQEQARSGHEWITTDMRPGDSPLWGMAKALARGQGDPAGRDIRRLLNRGREAAPVLTEALGLKKNQRICILVDQFEELFRFAKDTDLEEARLFTDVLVGLERTPPSGLYIILTMRSEFMGHCGRFRGLAEAINRSQYLLPRMEQPALVRAICEPASLYQGKLSMTLANNLIADAGGDQDQLPLIQHGLMRLWNRVTADPDNQVNQSPSMRAGGALREKPTRFDITLDDYLKIGGLKKALSNHANEVYSRLAPRDQLVAQTLFRVLTVHESDRSDLRRPTPFGTVLDIVSAGKPTANDRAQLKRVVECFSLPDRSFITPPKGTDLEDSVVLDIGHESLIRQWDKLKQWAKEEAEIAETYRELLAQTRRWRERKKDPWNALLGSGLLRGLIDIKRVAIWRNRTNEAWATLYGGAYDDVNNFISASRIHTLIRWALSMILVVAALVGYYYYQKQTDIREAKLRESEYQTKVAQEYRDAAMRNESGMWAILSLGQTRKGFSTAGMILGLDALHSNEVQRPYVYKAERALYAALHVPHETMTLEGHDNVVSSGAFSPDGKWIATGSWDRKAGVWNAETGRLKHSLKGHDSAVLHIAFSPNNDVLVTCSRDPTARVWNVETGALIHQLRGHTGLIRHAAFNSRGDRIVTASADRTSRIYDVRSGEEIHVLKGHSEVVEQAIFNAQETMVLTVSWDNTARIWNAETGTFLRILEGHDSAIRRAAFNSAGNRVVTASADETARIWDVNTGSVIHLLREHTDEVLYAEFSPRGDRIVTASRDNTARIWDVEKGVEIMVLKGHSGAVLHAEFSPQADLVVTASEDGSACLWDAETGELIYPLKRHDDKVLQAVFGPLGERVVTVSHDHTARIWDSQRNILHGHKDAVVDAAFSPGGRSIVTASTDNTARVWDVSKRKEVFTLKDHQGPVLRALFNLQGDRIVTASEDATARLWNAQSGDLIHVFEKHRAPVLSVAFSPSGDRVVTASEDASVRLWDARTGEQIQVLEGHKKAVVAVDFSPRGDHIVTASRDKTACVWDAQTGTKITVFDHHKEALSSAKFSPTGDFIATASEDRAICLWNPDTGELIRPPLFDHQTAVLKTSFNKDGNRLVSVSRDRTALLWDLEDKYQWRPFNLTHEGPVQNAVFNRKGNRVVTASEDGVAILWDVETANRISVINGHKETVNSVAFSPDGNLVLTASEDRSVRLWEIFEDTQALVEHAKKVVGNRSLSRKEHYRIYPD